MRLVYIISLVFVSLGAMATPGTNPFSKYTGCYDTVSLDGTPIPTNIESKLFSTKINDGTAFLYSDVSGKEIAASTIMFYQGYDGLNGVQKFDSADAFLDRGQFKEMGDETSFTFAGKLAYRFQQDIKWDVKETITIRRTGTDQLHVSAVREVKGNNAPANLNGAHTYDLKKKDCE